MLSPTIYIPRELMRKLAAGGLEEIVRSATACRAATSAAVRPPD